jgi:hypothetical protein
MEVARRIRAEKLANVSERESVPRVYGSTVVDIFIPPPSFKPVSLSLSRISSVL